LMGVPTVSAFQGFLRTEQYLASVGLLTKARGPGQVVKAASRFLSDHAREERTKHAKEVLDSMEDPAERVFGFILKALSED
jgi:predicted glycosyltransferase